MSPSRNIIVRIENEPSIGETVVDDNLRVIGKVFDVFGPVSSPYAAIRPTIGKPEDLVNRKLYVLPKRGERRR
ncbi:Gar1/Naf1 family protein [Candidatus Bathyarchaeota archaeon]|nr:Gar1/Naf1 family protein [Candidatus Bathyarchaeota archaeon]